MRVVRRNRAVPQSLAAVSRRPIKFTGVPRKYSTKRAEQVVKRPGYDDVVVGGKEEAHDHRGDAHALQQGTEGRDGVDGTGPGQLAHGELQVQEGNSQKQERGEVRDEEGAPARVPAQVGKPGKFTSSIKDLFYYNNST